MSNQVRLRAVEPEDVDFMLECESDRDASRWSDCRAPLSRTQLLNYTLTYDADPFRSGQLRLIAETSPDASQPGVPVGIVDLYDIRESDSRAFIGITLHPSFRSKGYGRQAISALLRLNSEKLGLSQLLAKVATVNSPALSLFDSSGFRRLALLPRWHKIGSSHLDFILFQISNFSDGFQSTHRSFPP